MTRSRRDHPNPLLHKRDGRILMLSECLNFLANGVAQVTLPWLVIDAGGSSADAAFVFTMSVIPYVIFALPAGYVGDRFKRKRILVASVLFEAAIVLPIVLWGTTGKPPVGLVLLVAAGLGLGRVFSDGAAFGAISSIAGREHFTEAQATLSAAWSVGMVAGPAIGGALIGAVGASTTMIATAAAFCVSSVLISILRTPLEQPGERATERPLEGLKQGFKVIAADPIIRSFTWMSGTLVLVSSGAQALIIPLLRNEIGLSSRQIGVILAVAASSGILTAVLVPALSWRLGGPRLCNLLIFVVSGGVLVLAFAGGFWSALVGFTLLLLAFGMMVSVWVGERQKRAPMALQGRVGISGRMVNTAGGGIGAAVAGALSGPLGLHTVYVVIAIAVAGIGLAVSPILHRANQLVRLPVAAAAD
jgi:MFS family permease